MATIKRRTGTANWTACFTDHAGKRLQKSTGLPNKKEAQKLADKLEAAAKIPPPPPPAPVISLRNWCDAWLAVNKGAVGTASFLAYTHRSGDLVEFLGDRADAGIETITKGEIINYRTSMMDRISPTSVNHALKIVRMIFEAARREGLITENPAADIKSLKRDAKVKRRPFTMPELKLLLTKASGEWKSIILFGIYTGQRLGDIAALTWANIDAAAGEIRFQSRKTGRFMAIPIAAPLARHIATLERPDAAGSPVHPVSAGWATPEKGKRSSILSRRFRDLMADAGMGERQSHRKTKQGRAARRDTQDLSFHSLRHTATSLMKNAGISEAVVMDIIGHDSPAVSAMYTHIDSAAKRKALDSMPDLMV